MLIQATMRLKNGEMARVRKSMGLSQTSLAELCEANVATINQIENLHLSRLTPTSPIILKLASILCLSTDVIAPPELCGKDIQTKFQQTADVDTCALLLYGEHRIKQQTLESPSDLIEHEDMTDYFMGLLTKNLHKLTEMQQKVITMKYGLDGELPKRNSDIARSLNRSREAIRIAERNGLTHIRKCFDSETRLLETKVYE